MGKRIYLRHLDVSDCERMHRWHNDADIYKTLTSPFHPVSMATVQEWIKKKSLYSDSEINYAICLVENDEHIGVIYMREIDYVNRRGFLGAFIGSPENRSKGYVREAVTDVVEYAYGTLGLKRLYMHTIADNYAAIKVLENCGFQIEGKMRQHMFKDGVFKDVLVLGMCESDYIEFKGHSK